MELDYGFPSPRAFPITGFMRLPCLEFLSAMLGILVLIEYIVANCYNLVNCIERKNFRRQQR